MSKRHFQEEVSFVNFLASILVNQLKQNKHIVYDIEEDSSLTIDPDRKVDNTIYRSAQIQSLVRALYYDSNDPFNLKVLASLQKLVPEELRLLIKGETLVGAAKYEDHSSTFIEEEDLRTPYIPGIYNNDGIDDDDIPF